MGLRFSGAAFVDALDREKANKKAQRFLDEMRGREDEVDYNEFIEEAAYRGLVENPAVAAIARSLAMRKKERMATAEAQAGRKRQIELGQAFEMATAPAEPARVPEGEVPQELAGYDLGGGPRFGGARSRSHAMSQVRKQFPDVTQKELEGVGLGNLPTDVQLASQNIRQQNAKRRQDRENFLDRMSQDRLSIQKESNQRQKLNLLEKHEDELSDKIEELESNLKFFDPQLDIGTSKADMQRDLQMYKTWLKQTQADLKTLSKDIGLPSIGGPREQQGGGQGTTGGQPQSVFGGIGSPRPDSTVPYRPDVASEAIEALRQRGINNPTREQIQYVIENATP